MYHPVLLTKSMGLNLDQVLRLVDSEPNHINQQYLQTTIKAPSVPDYLYKMNYCLIIAYKLVVI